MPATDPKLVPPIAETRVIAAIMLDSGSMRAVSNIIGAVDFTDPTLKTIYAAMLDITEDGRDITEVSLYESLKEAGKLGGVINSVMIGQLRDATPTSADIVHHAHTMYRATLSRILHARAQRFAERNGGNPVELIREFAEIGRDLEARLSALDNPDEDFNSIWTFADVETELGGIEWLWQDWLPRGFLTLIAGIDGIGKSKMALRFAQSIICGHPWPDGSAFALPMGCRPEVMYIDTEGSHGMNLARIKELHIPIDKINWPKDARHPNEKMGDILLDDPETLNKLDRVVRARRPALIVLDAVRGLFKGDENSSKDTWFLQAIAKLCRDVKVTATCLQHITKHQPDGLIGVVEMDDIRGSTAIRQSCRSIMAIDRPDPEQDELYRFRVLKLNLVLKPQALGVKHFGNAGLNFFPTAPSVPHKETKIAAAADALRGWLEKEPVEPRAVTWLKEQAEGAGIPWPTIIRAKDRLGIVPIPNRNGAKIGGWTWAMPARPGQIPQGENWMDR